MNAAGFEKVEAVFRQEAAKQPQGGLAFAATVEGEPVVDLVAGVANDGQPWQHDTRAVVMSVAKGWATMCLQQLYDQGRFTLDTKVADIWPEFAANGKAGITVRHVIDHTAGVIGVADVASLVQWDGGGWADLDAIADRLAAAKPAWTPGTQAGYHAVTFGWLAGELVRRLDETHRTLGTYFHEEIAAPLGVRCAIGVPVAEQGDIAAAIPGAPLMEAPWPLKKILDKAPALMRDPTTLLGRAFLGDGRISIMDSVDSLLVDGRFLAAEVPSSNGVSSAADLARLYSPLANGGGPLFERTSMDLFMRPGRPMTDMVMSSLTSAPIISGIIRKMATITRTEGGYQVNAKVAGKRSLGPNPLTVGNGGAGGQLAFADPDAHVTGGFVRTWLSPNNKSQEALVKALYECVK